MRDFHVYNSIALLLVCIVASPLMGDEKPRVPKGFGLTKVWAIDLTLSEKEFNAMQPALPGPPGAPPVAPIPAGRATERNAFGTAFPWSDGQMTVNGHGLEKISVRYAGDITYFVSGQNLKRPLRVRIANPEDEVRIGASSLQLHATPLDPAKSREALAFEVFRKAGVPAPATAFAEVTLTVPGVHDNAPKPVTMTTQEDHRQMLSQLGITRLRPGPSGDESAPNHANYDEARANPFSKLPEALTLNDGTPVTSPDDWWNKRRPEIVEDFEREVYGRVPANVPKVTWSVAETRQIKVGEIDVIEKQLHGRVDNSLCPEIEVTISMTLGTPKDAAMKVPVLMMFGRIGRSGFGPPGPSRTEILIKAGWGYAMISPQSIQADNGQGLTRGIIGLTNQGQPRKPDDWGALRAWAWGASRGLDALETDAAVDATRVGIEGVSRYGKAALVAMAFEPRFAAVLVGSSGEGGAKLHRRNFGEAVENLTGSGEYHWMAGNFLKYGAAEATFGSRNAGDLPVDSHQLIALCAPRPTFISYGIPEKGDAKWLDQRGSFMAAIAAGPVFRLLGAKDLGRSDDYASEQLPPVNEGLLDGALAWRQHDGGHTDTPNLQIFVDWANSRFSERD